jgi:hypothetical protein
MPVYGQDGLPLAYAGMGGEGACRSCRSFFERFRCGKNVGEGECDCPRCQGYCRCRREEVVFYE